MFNDRLTTMYTLKSMVARRSLVKPLGPSPLSYATVEAMFPPSPPPPPLDRIGETYQGNASATIASNMILATNRSIDSISKLTHLPARDDFLPSPNASTALDADEERMRREADEDRSSDNAGVHQAPSSSSAVDKERTRREKEESKNGDEGGSAGPPLRPLLLMNSRRICNASWTAEAREVLSVGRRKIKGEDRGASTPISNPPSAVIHFEERLQLEGKRDGSGGSGVDGGSEHGKDERAKASRKIHREDRKTPKSISSHSSVANELKEKMQCKLERHGDSGSRDSGGSEHGKDKHAKARPKTKREGCNLSTPILIPSSIINAFEEDILPKLERDGGSGSRGNGGPKHGRRNIQREDRSVSTPISIPPSIINEFKEKIRREVERAGGGGSGGDIRSNGWKAEQGKSRGADLGTRSQPDLLLPAQEAALVLLFLAILLWYGQTFVRKNKLKCHLSKLPSHDYIAKVKSQQEKRVGRVKEESSASEEPQGRERPVESSSQVCASVLTSSESEEEGMEMEAEIEKELVDAMASTKPHSNSWLNTRPAPDLTSPSPNGLLLLACLVQNHSMVPQGKQTFGFDPTSVDLDIPELGEGIPEIGEEEHHDIPDVIHISDN